MAQLTVQKRKQLKLSISLPDSWLPFLSLALISCLAVIASQESCSCVHPPVQSGDLLAAYWRLLSLSSVMVSLSRLVASQ